jgi:hypothetical protein
MRKYAGRRDNLTWDKSGQRLNPRSEYERGMLTIALKLNMLFRLNA